MKNIDNTPLHKKLGIKEGFTVKIINEPDNYLNSLNGIRETIYFRKVLNDRIDLIHLFTRSKKELIVEFPGLKKFIKITGALWVSWPEKSSQHISDLNESIVREIGLANGLIDTQICSIDDNWTAIKFVYPTKDGIK